MKIINSEHAGGILCPYVNHTDFIVMEKY
jgi:hypothetical protein